MSKRFIIAATTARAYAQAAVASGNEVIVLDAFADADLKSIANEVYQVKVQDWQLDIDDFKKKFSNINLDHVDGFCYAGLFDTSPTLLDWIAARVPVIGNQSETLARAKSYSFFELLTKLQIRHPKVSLEFPKTNDCWLAKSLGGSGGMHVKDAKHYVAGDYFQEKIVGEPVSMLFVANGKEMQVIGFNRQLVAPSAALPYRYAGAIAGIKMQDSIQQTFCIAAKLLTKELGLVGINSLDAILCGEILSVLELNPRLSASFELYPNLWNVHINACSGVLIPLSAKSSASAKMTVFADEDLKIEHDIVWPKWVVDVPSMDQLTNKMLIKSGAPICTVLAQEDTTEQVHFKLLERAKQLRDMMR